MSYIASGRSLVLYEIQSREISFKIWRSSKCPSLKLLLSIVHKLLCLLKSAIGAYLRQLEDSRFCYLLCSQSMRISNEMFSARRY